MSSRAPEETKEKRQKLQSETARESVEKRMGVAGRKGGGKRRDTTKGMKERRKKVKKKEREEKGGKTVGNKENV